MNCARCNKEVSWVMISTSSAPSYVLDGMDFVEGDCCWSCLDKMLADSQSEALKTAGILSALSKETLEKSGADTGNHTWNPNAHIELTLTAAECRKILELTGKYVEKVKL